MAPLNERERQKAAKHARLINRAAFDWYGRWRIANHDQHDIGQVAAFGLMRAARVHRPELGKFTTIAKRCMWSALNGARRWSAHPKRREPPRDPFYAPKGCDEDGYPLVSSCVFGEEVTAPDSEPFVTLERRELLARALSVLTHRERDILWSIARGEEQQDIARRLGVTEGRVTQIKTEAIKRARLFVGLKPNGRTP